MGIIVRLLITAIVAFGLTKFLSGVHFDSFSTAIIFAIVLGILNVVVKPILQLFGLPFTILTLGFFALVINTIVILMAEYFVDGMQIDGSWWAFIFSIALSFITWLLNSVFASGEK